MCLNTEITMETSRMINKKKLGFAVRNMVTCAKSKQTLVCGLLPAITQIEKSPEDVVFCLLPESTPGDAATHIQTVLLQAVCYENYIPVIQVDSSKKLGYICGFSSKNQGCNCAIIIRGRNMDSPLTDDKVHPLPKNEQFLTDFYESTSDIFPKPIIELPI